MNMVVSRSFGTHDGTFHADEVTACALLLVFGLIDREKIVRTRDPEKLATCAYVCDVGGIYNPQLQRFDHHQADYVGDMSSAGMVWLYLEDQGIVDAATYAFCNRSLISGIDAHDNGKMNPEVGWCSFSQVVSNFVPPMYDAEAALQNVAFAGALDFVLGHLRRMLERYHYIQYCREKVVQAMATDQPYLDFEEGMPWMETFFEMGGEKHGALFVIMPSGGHWKLRGIPPSFKERMKVRLPLPEKWAGLLNEDLQRASGIAGAIFCHKGRFVSVWQTRADALKALEIVLHEKVHRS